nr:solute carrier family 22 member 3-like [Nerophis lumbriciformis]
MADFSHILAQMGDFGPFQKKLVLLCSIPLIPFSFALAGSVFLSMTPDHWCAFPEAKRLLNECGWTQAHVMEYTIPRSGESFCHCERFEMNLSRWTCDDVYQHLVSKEAQVAPCNGEWEFNSSHSTIVSEFSLVCNMSWKAGLNHIMLRSGLLFSGFITGHMSDRFGRKPCFIGFMFFLGIAGVGVMLSPWYPLLLLFRFLQGFFERGAWTSGYVLLVEFVGPNYRKFVALMTSLFYDMGMVALPGLAYFISSWRTLQLILTLPWFLFIPYYWMVPESPRWLLAQRRNSEAMKIVAKVAKCNGRTLSQNLEEVTHLEKRSTAHPLSLLVLVKTPVLRQNTLILIYIWFSAGFVFHGLILHQVEAEKNLYLEFLVPSAMRFPVGFIIYMMVDRVGRRHFLAGTCLIGGIYCFAAPFIFTEHTWGKNAMKTIINMALSALLKTLFFANAELYPTNLRNLGLTVCSSSFDVAIMAAPFLHHWLTDIWPELPFCIYGVITVVNCGLVTLLPETKGVVLPDTVDEMEDLRRYEG